MNYILNSTIMLVAGAAIGSLVTWKIVKTKYERIAQEEIDSVKERFKASKTRAEKVEQENEEYVATINEQEYTSDEVSFEAKPHVINPEDLGGEEYEYEVISCTYYADGTLVEDETGRIVEDVKNTVGLDFVDHFGDYEEHIVHVRNEELKCDYEILRDVDPFVQP